MFLKCPKDNDQQWQELLKFVEESRIKGRRRLGALKESKEAKGGI